MADQGPLVRVDTDGRGNLLKLNRKQAEEYVATHAGAKMVGVRVASDAPSAAEESATAALAGGFHEGMTIAELRFYAEDNEIDLGDATKKADIVAALRANG